MEDNNLKRQICFAAAQLLKSRQESDFRTARWRAARSITRARIPPESVPTDLEIRLALQQIMTDHVSSNVSPSAIDDAPKSETRLQRYYDLLEPLDRVRLDPETHPEGDLLYHSLQVFQLAWDARPWDEEFLTAALLHEVGRGIDPFDAHTATLTAVQEIVSDRTFWLIENLPTQHRLFDGTIGIRARRRLTEHEDGEELLLLARCDSEGRVPGRQVPSLNEALDRLREMSLEE
ncbi:MAG: hypothetical protein Fues2KO_09720 [Fuerstiella sp.]